MTLREFANVFAALAIQLRQTDADEATIRVYYEPLKDLEIEFVAMAATRLAQENDWFPKSSEWRAMAAKVETERREAQRALMRNFPSPLCAACSDTGWTHDADKRVHRCDCWKRRRLELLGRQPWPALPAAPETTRTRTESDDVAPQHERSTCLVDVGDLAAHPRRRFLRQRLIRREMTMTDQKMVRVTAFTVTLLESVVATLERVNRTLETCMVRLDPYAWTREKIRDTQQHLDYIERMEWLREIELKAEADVLSEGA